jgi:hypothetical protein
VTIVCRLPYWASTMMLMIITVKNLLYQLCINVKQHSLLVGYSVVIVKSAAVPKLKSLAEELEHDVFDWVDEDNEEGGSDGGDNDDGGDDNGGDDDEDDDDE